jgi:uncharacterized protein
MPKVNRSSVFFQKHCIRTISDWGNSKSILLLVFFLWAVLPAGKTQTVFSAAAEVPNPKPSGYVSDPANILGDTFVQLINERAAAIEAATSAEFAVVVLPSIGEENPKAFATNLFSFWGIGKASKDNGLLILTVMDQRRTEFETGYGLEAVLPDILCYRLGMQYLVPHFKVDAYGQGILEVVQQFGQVLENPEVTEEIYAQESAPKSGKTSWAWLIIYMVINVLFHIFILSWLVTQLNSKQDAYLKYQSIRKIYNIVPALFFPIPYGFVMVFLKRKLEQLRNMKRYSKISGRPMIKLGEAEENPYLERGQVTEEELGSVDYDVWIADEDPDDILILRYEKRWSSWQKCPSCSYKTYHLAHTKVIRAATTHSSGEKLQTYSCEHCHYAREKIVIIPKLSSGGGSSSGGGGSSWGGGSSGGGGAGVSW